MIVSSGERMSCIRESPTARDAGPPPSRGRSDPAGIRILGSGRRWGKRPPTPTLGPSGPFDGCRSPGPQLLRVLQNAAPHLVVLPALARLAGGPKRLHPP